MDSVVRVLHAVGSMNRGGQETFIMNVYRNINRDKLQFDFLINDAQKCDYEDEINEMGGIIYRVPRRFPNYYAHLRALDVFFKNNNQYIAVHQHTNSCSAVSTLIYARKHKINKIIFHSHNSKPDAGIVPILFGFLYKPQIKKYATHFFACSSLAADNLFGKYVEKSEVSIVKNGIDSEIFRRKNDVRNKTRKEMDMNNKFVIGHIGRFSHAKNHTFILDIFHEINIMNQNAVLLLVGDGELRPIIEKKVESLGLNDNVLFLGVRKDIPELLCAIDVLLLPSLYEGLPVTLIEAQASGLPCIVSDVVTKEVAVTDLVEYLPLKASASYWAKRILAYSGGYERRDTQKEIKRSGFEIKDVALKLERFYLG